MKDTSQKALLYSLIFHFVLLLLIFVGLPQPKPKEVGVYQSVPVEIVDISQFTNVKKKSETAKQKPQAIVKPKKAARATSANDKIVKNLDKHKRLSDNILKTLAEKEEKPKEEPPIQKVADDLDEKFEALLKDIEDTKKSIPEIKTVEEKIEKSDDQTPADDRVESFSNKLSISEEDVLRRQIERCWNVPSGARDAENLVVELRVMMNEDRTVKKADIIGATMRMRADPFYRAAAESARRAVLNPRCSPLKLPEGKFNEWKTFKISFNPKDMLEAY